MVFRRLLPHFPTLTFKRKNPRNEVLLFLRIVSVSAFVGDPETLCSLLSVSWRVESLPTINDFCRA